MIETKKKVDKLLKEEKWEESSMILDRILITGYSILSYTVKSKERYELFKNI